MTFITCHGRKPALPTRIHVLWNKVRTARKEHTLKCGCVIGPGVKYHSTGVLMYDSRGQKVYTYAKQHLSGCIEKLH